MQPLAVARGSKHGSTWRNGFAPGKKTTSASDPANDVALRGSGLWLRNAATGTQRKWRSSRRFVDLPTLVTAFAFES